MNDRYVVADEKAGDALPVFSVVSPPRRNGVDGPKAVRDNVRTERNGKASVDASAGKLFHPSREWMMGDGTTVDVRRNTSR
jgi:hypothetical protein